ncbi:hypothetical protein C8F01DRAFT_503952 [Mycena amicta]|nr:hypothetical protein C8F01DRAFT_503952 [Mycena amicta]
MATALEGDPDVRGTIGAIFAGSLVAVGLSAILGFQTFLYFKIFHTDATRYKLLVVWIWLTDTTHTILICTAIWDYAVVHFANLARAQQIAPTLSLTVAITAITTLSVNIFYGWRIYKMSQHNWWITALIAILCLARTGVACVSTIEMLRKKTFASFSVDFDDYLIAGLAISAATDVVISLSRYYFLRNLRQGYPGTQEIVDVVVVFTINDGCLTCAVVIAALVCLLRMPHTLVWLGIYFSIAKLYSNSVLATLNLRNWYRHRQRPLGIPLSQRQGPSDTRTGAGSPISEVMISRVTSADKQMEGNGSTMEVFVDQQVEYNVSMASMTPEPLRKAPRTRR